MRAGEGSWQRETSDGSAWSSWASPVPEIFSFSDSFGTDKYNYFASFGYRAFSPLEFQGLLA